MTARRRYHFGAAGVMYVLVTLFLAIGASNSQNNLLFLAFSAAIGAGIASGVLSGAMMMGVRVERSLPAAATVGSPAIVRYTVRNLHRFLPIFAVTVEESDGRASRRGERATWMRLMPRPRGVVMHLGPGESVEVQATVQPTRRGIAEFNGVRLVSAFPFGLIRKSVTFESRASLVVAPRSERLRRDAASNLLSRAESGHASAAVLGRGDEFYGVRDYVPGDSPRLISWRATARTGALVVREHTTPTMGVLWIGLNFNTPAEDETIEQAVVLAASLVDSALQAGVEVGLLGPDSTTLVQPGAAPRQRPALMAALARVEPGVRRPRGARGEDPSDADQEARRAACIVVHSGGVDPSFGPAGARHLTAADLPRLTVSRANPAWGERGRG